MPIDPPAFPLTRRDVLLGAAGGLVAAVTPAAADMAQARPPVTADPTLSVSSIRLRRPHGRRQAGAGRSGRARRARLQRRAGRRHRCRRVATSSVLSERARGHHLRRQARRLHAAGRSGDAIAAASIGCTSRRVRRRSSASPAFEGIAPTPPLPASLDFALKRQEEPKQFEVVLFTDPQPESEAEVDFIREDVVEALDGTKAKFGITAGDVMFDDLSLYERYNRIIGTIGIPWWSVGGNHDLNFEAPDRHYSRETFKRVFGPNYYAFRCADALPVFLMLERCRLSGCEARPSPGGAGKYEGRLDAAQLGFVRNLLAHIPDDKLIPSSLQAHPVAQLSLTRKRPTI